MVKKCSDYKQKNHGKSGMPNDTIMPNQVSDLNIDFTDTEIAFSNKSDKELKRTAYLFQMMNRAWLVKLGSPLLLFAMKMRLPFVKNLVKATIFPQFCGGTHLMDCQEAIDKLYEHKALTILDYGAEAKTSEEELNKVKEEIVRAIELAASNNSVPVVSLKLTALTDNIILELIDSDSPLNDEQQIEYAKLVDRLDDICARAHELGVGVFVDAEESWMQEGIDALVFTMMEKYNSDKCIVYNTYQMYRHDKLEQLKSDHKIALEKGYILGVKFVRGAYMEKERARAKDRSYPSPIHIDKAAVDADFDATIEYCVKNYTTIGSCCASHNIKSNLLQAKLIVENNIQRDHPHLNFCQLFGMSDNITFNIAAAGFNVAKYVPYGPVKEVIPYLIRRAQENTSVTGEASRELALVKTELKRRKL